MEKQPDKVIDVELLNQAFEAFNQATEKLQSSYNVLQEEARKLREEVEDKNRQLSEVSGLLESVLMSSPSALVAIDEDGTVLMKNVEAGKLMDELGDDFTSAVCCFDEPGIYERELTGGRTVRVSVGDLAGEGVSGFVYVIDDITHMKQLELAKQRDERLKLMGEMAANIAHEIRNPLGAIELFASLLERDLARMPEKQRLTGSIVKGVRTINSIISNILLFTKELQPGIDRHYVADLVDDVVLYLGHLMRDKSVTFVNDLSEEHTVDCDAELMKQVMMNLIHNAIDAVPEGGSIHVTSAMENGETAVTVTDNGMGIGKDMLKKLFLPFVTDKAKGTGLGLAIVYKIVKAHGGSINADSDGKAYTAFTVTFPVKNGQ